MTTPRYTMDEITAAFILLKMSKVVRMFEQPIKASDPVPTQLLQASFNKEKATMNSFKTCPTIGDHQYSVNIPVGRKNKLARSTQNKQRYNTFVENVEFNQKKLHAGEYLSLEPIDIIKTSPDGIRAAPNLPAMSH